VTCDAPVHLELFSFVDFELETCMENFPRECRGKYLGCGNKICDNPARWEFNWRESCGRKNRKPTHGI